MLQLWCRLAAIALIAPLAWEPPYATSVVPKSKQQKKKKMSRTDGFKRNFYQTKKNLKLFFFFQKIEEGTLPKMCYEITSP